MSDIDLWNIDLLDTRLDLLDADIPSKYFVSLHSVFKISSRYVFKTSWRHVFKTFSRHVFTTSSRHVFKTSSRRLQRNSFSSSKMSSRRLAGCLQDVFEKPLQDIFKTSSRRRRRRKIIMLKTCWRHLQHVAPTNVCWLVCLDQMSCYFLCQW